jgi:hypothetical protein
MAPEAPGTSPRPDQGEWQIVADSQRTKFDPLAARVAAGQTVRAAARAVKTSERTAYRWAAEPAFKARVAELRAAMASASAGVLADGMAAAARALRQLLKAKDLTVRLRACRLVLELATKLRDAGELEERVRGLEQRQAELGGNR